MNYFLIIVCALAFTCNGFATRLFQTRFKDQKKNLPLFQSLYCLISTLCFWGAGGFALPTLTTALYGISFGVLFCLATAMGARAMETGSMAISSVIMNMGLIIPILYSVFMLDEKLTLLHIIGFILFVTSVIFSSLGGKENKKASLLWLVTVIVGLLANGLTATIQKVYIMKTPTSQDSVFLGVAYATASLCFAVKYMLSKSRASRELESGSNEKGTDGLYIIKFIGVSLLASIGSFIGNLLLGKLTVNVIAAILYPCVNGGLAVFTTLVSFIIFKEKPTANKLLSILFGCAAIIILNLG